MKNDQGQLMLVPGGSHVNSPVRPVLQVKLFCRFVYQIGSVNA